MTSSLEKIFFNYILRNKNYFDIVRPYFYQNIEIQFIYGIIREYIITKSNAQVPSARQIFDMISLEDTEKMISKEILKSILNVNLAEYDEKNFIEPKLNAWILTNRLKSGTVDIIDETRNFDSISDFDKAIEAAGRIRAIVEEMSSTNFANDDDDMGSDFDSAENHVQDNFRNKVSCGFETIDHMLSGGFDIGTLNCIMAQTSGGKSLWMQNFAVRASNLGYNVLYITLEMSEKKVIKRLGSMRLKIPINDYDKVSSDVDLIRKKISNLGADREGGDLFKNKVGKIYTKFWAAGTSTVLDFDNYVEKMQRKKGIVFNLIIVDYITLIAPIKGIAGDNLYSKGKHLAEGLRALGAKYKCPVITGIQVAKDAWNASDITLESIPESKAIAETADTFFVIIRTEEMRRQNLYRFKLLKQRDGDFLKSQIRINLNPTYLTLEGDQFVDIS